MHFFKSKAAIPNPSDALPGREEPITTADEHYVNHVPIKPPLPSHLQSAMFGMGCFWGVEKCFWQLKGVFTTAVGYAGGFTPNPTYDEVCSGLTGHNEVVWLKFDPQIISYQQLLKVFWEGHDPTQGMRQGNDMGTQYRSGIYCFTDEQLKLANESRDHFQKRLNQSGFTEITTEILTAPSFYYAEAYHQQYLAKNPHGYCGMGGCGVVFDD